MFCFTETRIKESGNDGKDSESDSESEAEFHDIVTEFYPLASSSSRATVFSNPEGTCSCHAFRLLRKCPHVVYLKDETVTNIPGDKDLQNIIKRSTYVDVDSLRVLRQEFIPELIKETSTIQDTERDVELQFLPADDNIDSSLKKALEYLQTAVRKCQSAERKMKMEAILTNAVETCKQELGCNHLQPHRDNSDSNKRIRTLKEFMSKRSKNTLL